MATLLFVFSTYRFALIFIEGYPESFGIIAECIGFIFGLINLIYHYKKGGINIPLVLTWLLAIGFIIPYFILNLLMFLKYEISHICFVYYDYQRPCSKYQQLIFEKNADVYYILTLIFKLSAGMATVASFLVLRIRDVIAQRLKA